MSTLAAALIGATCWGTWWSIGFAFAVPILVGLQLRRSWAGAVTLAYYAAASWPLIRTYATFAEANTRSATLTWIVAAGFLSLPLTVAWTANRTAAAWRLPLAFAAGVLPPLGLIGWASPAVSAGVLFPETAWLGLTAVIVAPGLVLVGGMRVWNTVVVASALCHCFSEPVAPPSQWTGVQTSFAPGQRLDALSELIASDLVQRIGVGTSERVTVFPETVISRWTIATEVFWEPTLEKLHRQRRRAVIGTGLDIPDSPDYENAALVIGGDQTRAFLQRIPVPVGMWRPFGATPSVPLRLNRPGTIKIDGHRVAFLICYEQLLVLPMLLSAIEHPTVIVGIANQYWVRETSIPAAQRASLMAWSRLFALPLLIAENR